MRIRTSRLLSGVSDLWLRFLETYYGLLETAVALAGRQEPRTDP
ncbi:MAG: hypothetical protein AAF393_09170 [Pseudomonadota bacterium]